MYTGLLDVLHDAADVDFLPVRDRIHVDLRVILHKLVDEGGVSWARARAGPEVEIEVIVVVDDLHPAPAEDVEGRTTTGYPSSRATSLASSGVDAVPNLGCGMPRSARSLPNLERSSARSMASGEVPRIRTPASSSSCASFRGLWPPNCKMTPSGSSRFITSSTCSAVSGSK